MLKSVSKVDLTKAFHGSVLDIALHAQTLNGDEAMHKFKSLIRVFLDLPCTATLQMNIIDRETLLQARECSDDPAFQTLIVRVWGFSAVFVELPPALQAMSWHGLNTGSETGSDSYLSNINQYRIWME